MGGICGLFSSEVAAEWVTALAAVLSLVVIGIGLVFARGQLLISNKQREDSIDLERLRVTLDYIEDFRSGKYMISCGPDLRESYELTPDYAIERADDLASEENFPNLMGGQLDADDRFIINIVSVALNFWAQTQNLMLSNRLDDDVLFALLWGRILKTDEACRRLAAKFPDFQERVDLPGFLKLVKRAREWGEEFEMSRAEISDETPDL